MRKPATDAELERVDVTDADIQHFIRMCNRVQDRARRAGLNANDPVLGVAMMRAGTTAAMLLGLPVEDCTRMVVDACELFEPPAGKDTVMPDLPTADVLNALAQRCAHVVVGALRNEAPSDNAAVALNIGVSILRFAAHSTDTVLSLFAACWKDAERSIAEMGRRGAQA